MRVIYLQFTFICSHMSIRCQIISGTRCRDDDGATHAGRLADPVPQVASSAILSESPNYCSWKFCGAVASGSAVEYGMLCDII